MSIQDRRDPANFIIEHKWHREYQEDRYFAFYFDPVAGSKELVISSKNKYVCWAEIEDYGCKTPADVRVVDLREPH